MGRTATKQTEVEHIVEQMVALARGLSTERLRSALDYIRFLAGEDEDDDWPAETAEEQADVAAFHKGDHSRFVALDQARRTLDAG